MTISQRRASRDPGFPSWAHEAPNAEDLAAPSLTLPEALARVCGVQAEAVRLAEVGDTGGRLVCVFLGEAGWIVAGGHPVVMAAWDLYPEKMMGESRLELLKRLLDGAQETASLVSFDSPETDGTGTVIVALVRLWWEHERDRGLDPWDARFLLALSASSGLLEAATAAGVPAGP